MGYRREIDSFLKGLNSALVESGLVVLNTGARQTLVVLALQGQWAVLPTPLVLRVRSMSNNIEEILLEDDGREERVAVFLDGDKQDFAESQRSAINLTAALVYAACTQAHCAQAEGRKEADHE